MTGSAGSAGPARASGVAGAAAMPVCDPERQARAGLSRAVTPEDGAVLALLPALGPVELWSRLVGDDLADLRPRLPTAARDQLDRAVRRAAAADPGADLAAVAALGGRLVCPGDAEWPARLADLDRPEAEGLGSPPALWVCGPLDLAACTDRSVAIVGSRAATHYGLTVASDWAGDLADRGMTVVSGGAFGVDAAAHRGALAAGGSTVAVLAGGVDVLYPRGNDRLLRQIRAAGLLVSESPPGSSPLRHRFLSRNRLIAALGSATLVVEAAARSGALSTARHAGRLLRPLLVVPGPVTSALSTGPHRLVREGQAVLAASAADVAEAVDPIGGAAAAQGGLFDGTPVAGTETAVPAGPDPRRSGPGATVGRSTGVGRATGVGPAVGSGPASLGRAADAGPEVGGQPACSASAGSGGGGQPVCSPHAGQVLTALPARRGRSTAQLALHTGLDPIDVGRALAELAVLGLAESTAAGWRRAPG